MVCFYSKDYGFNRFVVRYNNNEYKTAKFGYFYSTIWEAYIVVVFCSGLNHKEKEFRFALKSQANSDRLIDAVIQKLITDGTINISQFMG